MIDPISQTIIRKLDEKVKQEKQASAFETSAYRITCPNCKALLVKEVLLEEGCFKCGWKMKPK